MKYVLAFLLTAASPGTATRDGGTGSAVTLAEPIQAKSRVFPERVRLGEPFLYEIELVHRPDQRFDLRLPPELGPFEMLEHSRNRVDGAKESTTTFKIKLALFDLGKQKIPDFAFDEVEPNASGQYVVPGAEVEGASALPKNAEEKGAELYDIKPPEDVPIRTYQLLWIAFYVAALAAIGYALYCWSRRRRSRSQVVVAGPVQPLDVRTLAALDELRQQDLPQTGRFREFYFRLSEILRAYLGERYGFDALECTSTELLHHLRQRVTPGLPLEELAGFVQRADLVKFAKAQSSPIECKESLEFGYRLVRQTYSEPAPTSVPLHAPAADLS